MKVLKIGGEKPEVEVMPAEDYVMPELKIVVAELNKPFCPHEHIKVWEYHRIVKCSDCGQNLDPFEYLLDVGKKERGQLSHLTWLRYEVKNKLEEIEDLKKKIRILKKQLKP